MYRYLATSIPGFIQQLAVGYVARGYVFYIVGTIPIGKMVEAVDAKIIEQYEIAVSKSTRCRERKAGKAAVQYLRYGRSFVLLATPGQHRFFEQERTALYDVRERPIRLFGYSVSYRGGHAHVRIEGEEYRALRRHFLALAVHRQADYLEEEFRALPYEPYAPVRWQLLGLFRQVNRARKMAGFRLLDRECLRLGRRQVKPFAVIKRS